MPGCCRSSPARHCAGTAASSAGRATAALPELPWARRSPAISPRRGVATFFRESGTEHGDMRFRSPSRPAATLTVAGSAAMRLAIVCVVRPGNFAAADSRRRWSMAPATTPAGAHAGTPLAGAIAVLDFRLAMPRRLLRFSRARLHLLTAPTTTGPWTNDWRRSPSRYYGERAATARRLAPRSLSATVAAPSRWTNRSCDLWALVLAPIRS